MKTALVRCFVGIIAVVSMFASRETLSQNVTEVTGTDTLVLDNSKSIHHEVNRYSKNLIRQAAVYDAIEKGADIRVTRKVFSSTDENGEEHFEKFFERVLQQYNVTWKLNSEEFRQLSKKKWVCIVQGIVTSEKAENIDFGMMTDQPEFNETFIISDKRFNKISVNNSYRVGTRLGVYKTILRKTVSGYASKEVVKGLLYVDYQDDHYCDARIVRGLFRVHEKNEVKPLAYNTNL